MNSKVLVTLAEAASMCSISPKQYIAWVNKGIVPGPVKGTRRYSVRSIEAAIDESCGIKLDPYEKWKADQNEVDSRS